MKTIMTYSCWLNLFMFSYAQTRINASKIIEQINEREIISYSNMEIEGNLDFTHLENIKRIRTPHNWFNSKDRVYESYVNTSVDFIDCTFLGDVIAFRREKKNEAYIAHFNEAVLFRNCNFKGMSEFKYSEFVKTVEFSESTFNRAANFKYAEFTEGPTFTNTKFEGDADFKYVKFPRGTSFENATFNRLANFKYSKFRTPLHFKYVIFRGKEDFKFTTVDGHSFTSFLLNNR